MNLPKKVITFLGGQYDGFEMETYTDAIYVFPAKGIVYSATNKKTREGFAVFVYKGCEGCLSP